MGLGGLGFRDWGGGLKGLGVLRGCRIEGCGHWGLRVSGLEV